MGAAALTIVVTICCSPPREQRKISPSKSLSDCWWLQIATHKVGAKSTHEN